MMSYTKRFAMAYMVGGEGRCTSLGMKAGGGEGNLMGGGYDGVAGSMRLCLMCDSYLSMLRVTDRH